MAGAAASEILILEVRLQEGVLGSRAECEAMLQGCEAARLPPVRDELRSGFDQRRQRRS